MVDHPTHDHQATGGPSSSFDSSDNCGHTQDPLPQGHHSLPNKGDSELLDSPMDTLMTQIPEILDLKSTNSFSLIIESDPLTKDDSDNRMQHGGQTTIESSSTITTTAIRPLNQPPSGSRQANSESGLTNDDPKNDDVGVLDPGTSTVQWSESKLKSSDTKPTLKSNETSLRTSVSMDDVSESENNEPDPITHPLDNRETRPYAGRPNDAPTTHGTRSSTMIFTQSFVDRLDTLIDQIDGRLKITPVDAGEIPPDGYNDLGETMGVDLLSTYHIDYIHPLGKPMDEIKEETKRHLAVPHTRDELLELINDDSNSDSEFDGSGGSPWFNRFKKKSRSTKIERSPGHRNEQPHIDSDRAHMVETPTDQLPLKDHPDVVTRNLKTTGETPDAQSDVTNSGKHPIATASPSRGWMIVFKLDGRYYAYERNAMDRPIEVIYTGSGLNVTGRGLYDADKTWPVLPEWARETIVTRVVNADLVDWVPLRPEDVEDLPSGAVFFDFKSRGYSYGEMIDRVDRLKILGELNDLDQPRNRHQRRGY